MQRNGVAGVSVLVMHLTDEKFDAQAATVPHTIDGHTTTGHLETLRRPFVITGKCFLKSAADEIWRRM